MPIELGPVTERRLHEPTFRPNAEEKVRLHAAVAEALKNAGSGIALLTSGQVRRRLYELVSVEFPRFPVLSRDEIAPGKEGLFKTVIDPLAPAA